MLASSFLRAGKCIATLYSRLSGKATGRAFRGGLTALLLLLLLTPSATGILQAQTRPDEQRLLDAWKLAERSGRYHFTSQVTQKTIPAPRLSSVGQAVKTDFLTVQGAIDRSSDTLELSVWDNPATAFDPQSALELRIEAGAAQGRVPGGEWQPLDGVSDTFAPGGDVAAYLLAARHITALGLEKRNLAPLGKTLISRRYHFVIDGDVLAEVMRAQMEAEMRRKGELPPGVYLGLSDTYRQAVGRGEAWVDEDGLPQRMKVEIEYPQQQNGERLLVSVQTDFSDFDRSLLALGGSALSNRLAIVRYDLARAVDPSQMAGAAAFAFFLGVAAFLLSRLSSRRRHTVISLVVLLAMLAVEVGKAAPLPAQMAAAVASPPQSVPADKPLPTPTPPSEFDTRQNPLSDQPILPASEPGIFSRQAGMTNDAQTLADGPDADRDGLSDALEAIWKTQANNRDSDGDGLTDGQEVGLCVDLLAGTTGGKLTGRNALAPACANPLATDTDGDGLTDGQEVLRLGTSPNNGDTDGDGLTDPVEVKGFNAGGETRYTDPVNPDTDGDGILDGTECPNANCNINSGGRGEVDVFDIDNDGDGFVGSFDLSPNLALGQAAPFTGANPFQLSLANLNPDKSVFVDFQIRPVDPNQIGYAQSVLDWPAGDTQGQIQRRLETTFADVNPLPGNLTPPNPYPASYGDMRLVPMLEIEMPATGAPLPRTTAAQTVTFASTPLLAVVEIIKDVEPINILGFTAEPEALRVRVNHLNPDYANYTLEIYKATCQTIGNTPVFPAASLSASGQVSYSDGELSVIGDGGHVAVLKAPNLAANCVPIPKVKEDVSQVPLNFVGPVQAFGSLGLTQAGNSQIALNLSATVSPAQHQIEFYSGSCQKRGAIQGSPLALTPGTLATLSGLNLVALANGAHVALLKKGSVTLACAPLGNVVNGASSETRMIDGAALAKMGITVAEKDAGGALLAYVPLTVAQDPHTGVTSGFAGTMRYETDGLTGSIGWQNPVRMSWWVQVLTDNCTTPPADFMAGRDEQSRLAAWCGSNANQLQLVQVYDGEWWLAGLSVREEQSYDMDIIYEDPASDANPDSDDYLWHLARGLDEQFVTGVDCVRINPTDACGQNGQRDVTLATINATFDKTANGSASQTDRWGIPAQTFQVEKLHDKLDTYVDVGLVMGKYVPDLLQSRFLDNGKPRAQAPLLLFASENSFRSVALGTANYATSSANGATINFAPSGQPVQSVVTVASLNWAPYRYNESGGRWESYPFADYWDQLELRLKASGPFGDGQDEDSRIIGEGMRLIAKSYFAYLYQGRANLVQIDSTPMGLLDSSAALYISRQERADTVVKVGDEVNTATGVALLMNLALQPFVQNLIQEFSLRQFQLTALANIKTTNVMQSILVSGLAPDNTTYRGLLRNVFLGLKGDLNQNYVQGLKLANRKITFGVAGIAAVVVLVGVGAAIKLGVEGQSAGTAQQVLTAVGTSIGIISLVALTNAARNAAQGVAGLAAKVAAINQQLATTSKAAQRAGVVGLLIVQVINYGGLIAAIVSNGYTLFSLQANQLAASAIASSITAALAFALSTTGVGAIVVAIIGLIDGLIFLICGFLSEEQNESIPGIFFCRGISGWVTELISVGIYAQNEITRINDPYRLNYLSFSPGLADPAGGFHPNAPVAVDLTVRNTLRLAHLPVNLGILYGWQFSEESLRTSRFAYDILTSQPAEDAGQLHDSLSRGDGPDPWVLVPQPPEFSDTAVYTDVRVIKNSGISLPPTPGINRSVPGYLAEGYQVPVQECVANPGILPLPPFVICWVRSRGDTNYNDLNLVFDVLPAGLAEFYALSEVNGQPGRYRLGWDNNSSVSFPPLLDADGDGLTFDADSDDTRWDIDGDGLSDAVEKERHTRPDQPDSDNDGLSDVAEALWKTDPNDPDSDGDGLTDGQEVAGWSIGYGVDAGGTPLLSWSRSDPLSRDVDGDEILDSKEKVFGFNPNLPNDPSALLYSADLRESQAPLLLTRFEERAGATTFSDDSGQTAGNVAGCEAEKCPIAGIQGRFGNAAHFNGSDQYLTIPPNPAIGALRTNFTLSAWVKPATLSGTQAVIQIGPGGPNGVGGITFGLSGDDLFARFEGGGGTFVQPLDAGVIPLEQWTQIGVEVYPVEDRLYFSVNGVEKGSQIGIRKAASSNPEITIGAARQPASNTAPSDKDAPAVPQVQVDHFAGSIDEVLIQDWVPIDISSIQAIFAGRYNLADLILRPGQPVAYTSAMENALVNRRISGQRQINYPAQLTDAASATTPFVLDATRRASYDDSFRVSPTAASGIYTLTQSVGATISIPTEDVWVAPGSNQIFSWNGPQTFAGVGSTDSGSKSINLNNKSFTIAGWVRPTAGDSARRGILGRNSGQNNAFPYLISEGRKLKFGFGTNSSLVEVAASNGVNTDVLNLNRWNFVAVRYDVSGTKLVTFFVNGATLNSTATNATPDTSDRSFFIGRASNLGKISLSQFLLTCEGDGPGDGQYDIIGNGENLAHLVGTETKPFPLSVTRTFNENYQILVCEDDNGIKTDCASNDEFMGSLFFNTSQPSVGDSVKLANPFSATSCSYDWGMAGWPDMGTLSYSFTNDSLPFVGDLRQFEIHTAALSDTAIQNLRSHGEQVAQFRLDEYSGATNFEDYIAYHQLSCSGAQCPQAGVDGKQNVALRFDGVDDSLGESPTININDKISTDIAAGNSGFAISLWIKPEKPAGAVNNSVISVASFTTANGSKGELNLVHKSSPSEGFTIFYRDEETDRPFSEIGNCQAPNGVWDYGEWVHTSISMDAARQTANLYTYGFRCSTPQIPLQATYVPKAGDFFTLGYNSTKPAYLRYKGAMDDVYLHRRPLTETEVKAIYRRGVYVHWDLDTPEAAPTEPVRGVMRQALGFNRFADRYPLVDDRADIFNYDGEIDGNPATPNPITFSMWVRAEDTANRKRPLLSIPTKQLPANNDFAIYLDNGTPKIQFYQSNSGTNLTGAADKKISEGVWQHLVFRKDEAGVMSIFINGYKASNIAGNWATSKVRSPAAGLILGADTLDSSFFKGRVDEVMVYRAALTDQEIRELYNYQNAWVDETIENSVTVDAEPPTSALQLDSLYLPNRDQRLYVAAQDTTSGVFHVELGVDKGAGVVWSGAEADETDGTGNTWLPLFAPSGDGVYTLSSRATDRVGNQETPAAAKVVYVDARPPSFTFNDSTALTRPDPSTTEEAIWYLRLNGASFDPIIQNTNQAGSGVASIDVTLYNKNGETATLFDTQAATINPDTGSWSVDYKLNLANPTGVYTATAVATDRVGNSSNATPIVLRIDTTAPTAHITLLQSPAGPQGRASDAPEAAFPAILGKGSTVGGTVSESPGDVVAQTQVAGVSYVEMALEPLFSQGSSFRNTPLPGSTLLYLPLDESSRSDSPDRSFGDVSPAGQLPTICAGDSCPQAGAAGKMGQALDFDGVNDSLTLTNTASINGLTNDFTVAAWVKPSTLPGIARIASVARTNSTNGFGLGLFGGKLLFTTYGVQDYLSSQEIVGPNVWQHVAVYLTPDNASEFYINGQLVETVAGSAPAKADGDDRLLIGATTEPGQTATSQHFPGLIDEVMIRTGRPSAADWQTLLGAEPTLHLPFDEPFIHPNAKFRNGAGLAVADLAYLASNLPADRNLRATGIVGAGALRVDESEGALIGGVAPGVVAHQNGPFSLSFWAALDDANSTMALWIGKFENLGRLMLRATSVAAEFTDKPDLTVSTGNLVGAWQHVLLTYDGSSRVLYLNGSEIGRDTIAPNALDTAAGALVVAGGTGYLDDVRVYRYALNANEAKALVETGWLLADVVRTREVEAETTWSATVPTGLEGFYQLRTRGSDLLGNVGDEPNEVVTWRGIVDSLAPRLLSFNSTPGAGGITFSLTVEDFDLAASGVTMPAACTSANTTVTPELYRSPWYLSFAAQATTAEEAAQAANRTFRLTIQCQASFAKTNDSFRLCDTAGNCTDAVYTGPDVGTGEPGYLLYLPAVQKR